MDTMSGYWKTPIRVMLDYEPVICCIPVNWRWLERIPRVMRGTASSSAQESTEKTTRSRFAGDRQSGNAETYTRYELSSILLPTKG